MRVAIITSVPIGGASAALQALAAVPEIEVAYVVVSNQSRSIGRWRQILRKWKKAWQIGPLGAINGLRMRAWFKHTVAGNIRQVAASLGVRVVEVAEVNCDQTAAIFSADPVDLAISLGNGYIQERIFSIPTHGMINYHGELLPEYPGALSIVWPIYFGRTRTGFTIHRIDKGIDTGDILMRREFEIEFGETLRQTIHATGTLIHPCMPGAIADVVRHWDVVRCCALPQTVEQRFTTPTFAQYLRMEANNRRLYAESQVRLGGDSVGLR